MQRQHRSANAISAAAVEHEPPQSEAGAQDASGLAALRRIVEETQAVDEDHFATTGTENFAAAAHGVHARWASQTPEQRVEDLMAAANAELARMGIPNVPWAFGSVGGATAGFVLQRWSIVIDRATFASPTVPTQPMMAVLATLIYHECRHAQQLFQVLRLAPAHPGVMEGLGSEPAIASVRERAQARPLAHDTPEGQQALAWANAMSDPETHRIEREAGEANAKNQALISREMGVLTDPNSSEKARAKSLKRIEPVLKKLRAYMELPFEADAYAVGNDVARLYTTLEDPAQ